MSRKLKNTLSLLLVCSASLLLTAVSNESRIRLESEQDFSRLIIKSHSAIDIAWKEIPGGFEVLFKGMTLTDLGAPFGLERKWAEKYRGLKDKRLSLLRFYDADEGVKFIGRWKFPKGPSAPAYPKMNTFHFRDHAKNQFVLDFWVEKGPTWTEVKQKQIQAKRKKAYQEIEKRLKRRVASRKESIQRNTEIADTEKFCKRELSEAYDIFLPFKPAHKSVDFSQIYPLTMPDNDYPYWQPEGQSREAKYIRLALDLYDKGKYGLAIRTIEFFDRDIKNSKNELQMKFLHANILMRLGHLDKAKVILSEIMHENPKSPVALNSVIYLAGDAFQRKSYLESLEKFLWLIKFHPEHRLNWSFHLGVAESAYYLKQSERALTAFRWILANSKDDSIKTRAGLRMGDLFLDRYQYAQALAYYYKGIKQFGKYADTYPEVYVNRGESLYWLKEYDRAKVEYKKFLKKFKTHPLSWRATFRLAEIEGREKGRTKVYQDWLYQTINQNPYSPGAILARIRMAPCGDHGGFNLASAERFFEGDANKIKASNEIDMKDYYDFKGLSEFRTYIRMKQEAKAIEVAARLLRGKLSVRSYEIVTAGFNLVFRKYILDLLNKDQKFMAISTYKRYQWAFSEKSHPVLYDFLLKLSQASANLGFGSLAMQLNDKYDRLTREWRGREIASRDVLDIDIRQRQAEENYSLAKAVWVSEGLKKEKQILARLKLIDGESKLAYEKELLLSSIFMEKKNYKKSLKHLSKAKLLVPKKLKQEEAQIDYQIIKLHDLTKNTNIAVGLVDRYIKKYFKELKYKQDRKKSRFELPDVPQLKKIYQLQASYYEKLSQWGKAAKSYEKSIESGDTSNRSKFSYARALDKIGQVQETDKAISIFKEVAKSKDKDFWTQLAQEALVTKGINIEENQGG